MTGERLTLACVATDSGVGTAIQEALAVLFPDAAVTRVDPAVERIFLEGVHCAVIDGTGDGVAGMDILRRLRAGGYAGGAVLMHDPPAADPEANRLGARLCAVDDSLITALGDGVVAALRVQGDDADPSSLTSAAFRALRHTQQLMAAGELALRLQHSLNNPLAALLAEAQLLALEDLPPEHQASVGRIIGLCKRVVNVVRGLDGVGRA